MSHENVKQIGKERKKVCHLYGGHCRYRMPLGKQGDLSEKNKCNKKDNATHRFDRNMSNVGMYFLYMT